MKRWFANSLGVLLAVGLASAVVSSQGQSSPSARPGYTPPKTPWAIPICKAFGLARTWSACPSSDRSDLARACI